MTEIPATTLVCVDCQYPVLALRALRQTMAQCRYAAVKLLTDASGPALDDPRIERVAIKRIDSVQAYSRFMTKELLRHVATDFVQVVQWDGYVVRGAAWRSEFQDYDYIGARWWFAKPGRDVGNGGFSLRSRRLLEALQDPDVTMTDSEDRLICLVHREMLESRHGIRVAPGALAQQYAFEGERPNPQAFGFHGMFNLPLYCDAPALAGVLERLPEGTLAARGAAMAAISMLRRLLKLGRREETLSYARRLLREGGDATLAGKWVENFDDIVGQLVPGTGPCTCGSGRLSPLCCGTL